MPKLGDVVQKKVRKLADAVAAPPKIVKGVDASGHEHGDDGQFVATGTQVTHHADGKQTWSKIHAPYTLRRNATGGTVHDHTGKEVGHVLVQTARPRPYDENGRTRHIGTYTGGKKPKAVADISAPGGENAEHTGSAFRAVALEHFRGRLKTKTEKSATGGARVTYECDVIKVRDDSGHEHDKGGRFTTSSGGGGKTEVHHSEDGHVGTVSSGKDDNGRDRVRAHLHGPEGQPPTLVSSSHSGMHDWRGESAEVKHGVGQIIAAHNERKGSEGGPPSQDEAHRKATAALAEHYGAGRTDNNGKNDPKGMGARSAPDAALGDSEKRGLHGLLARAGSMLTGKRQTAKQRIEDAHTNPQTGAVEYDRALAERINGGHMPPSSVSSPKAVFSLGGAGVGKSGLIESYVGNEGLEDKDGAIITPGHPDFKAPQPGFSRARLLDADSEKKKNPLYSSKMGLKPDGTAAPASDMYGPGGPRTASALAQYTPEEQEKVHAHVRAQTNFKDAHDYARNAITGPRNPAAADAGDLSEGHFNDGTNSETEFDDGLTHELSSHVTKNKLAHFLEHPEDGSFVYDATGPKNHIGVANRALDNGFHVDVAEATDSNGDVARPEVAQYRNQGRDRTINPALVAKTHRVIKDWSPKIRAYVNQERDKGRPIRHIGTPTMTEEDVAEALNAGMTPDGPPAGFEHPKKKAARLKKEETQRLRDRQPRLSETKPDPKPTYRQPYNRGGYASN